METNTETPTEDNIIDGVFNDTATDEEIEQAILDAEATDALKAEAEAEANAEGPSEEELAKAAEAEKAKKEKAKAKVNPEIEALTMDYSDDEGTLLVKQLDKAVITKGAWATIMFKYANLDKATQEFGEPKISLRRFQKREGAYKIKSKFNISNKEQARSIIGVLKEWTSGKAKAIAE